MLFRLPALKEPIRPSRSAVYKREIEFGVAPGVLVISAKVFDGLPSKIPAVTKELVCKNFLRLFMHYGFQKVTEASEVIVTKVIALDR